MVCVEEVVVVGEVGIIEELKLRDVQHLKRYTGTRNGRSVAN